MHVALFGFLLSDKTICNDVCSQSSREESEHREADVDDDGRRDPSASAFNPPPWSVIKKNNFSQVWQPPPHPPPKIAMYNANQRRRREMEAIKSEDIQVLANRVNKDVLQRKRMDMLKTAGDRGCSRSIRIQRVESSEGGPGFRTV